MIADSIADIIGNTPIVRLNNINSNILAKCEFMNPLGSVKDRIALKMIKSAIEDKKIDKNGTIIEATSGNTGIALAGICASLNIKLILTMPESMSKERVDLLKGLGAKVILTKAQDGMIGSINEAIKINNELKNSFIIGQFENENNVKSHEETTALEILKELPNLKYFITSIGTGGTISGIAKILKEKNSNIKIIGIEPKQSPLISKGEFNTHKIQGIGANFIPKILNLDLIDEIVTIDENEAIDMAKALAKKEGLMVGISAGANVCGAIKLSEKYDNEEILTILCDSGQRYLSCGLYE
jgi:cysteine synthase A